MTFTKNNLVSIFAFIILGIGLITSYFLNYQTSSTHSSLCDISQHVCEITIGNHTLNVSFAAPPQVEERLFLNITSENAFEITNASIHGINMYMGSIPVVTENTQTFGWTGWTYLGACAEPNMVWDLEIGVNTEQGIKKGHLKFKTSFH